MWQKLAVVPGHSVPARRRCAVGKLGPSKVLRGRAPSSPHHAGALTIFSGRASEGFYVRHDWQSEAYVDEWIEHDIARNDERRPRLRRMVALARFPRDAVVTGHSAGA